MRSILLASALIAAAFAAPSNAARADNPPRYLVLQPVYRGQATPVRTYAYAYGWFGAQPSSESTMHRNYTHTGKTWTYQP